MLITKYVTVEDRVYPVTLSDNFEALQAAYAAGGAVVGLWHDPAAQETEPGAEPEANMGTVPPGCLYLTDSPEAADQALLEKAVRRRLGLPFLIGITKRLIIREFKESDPLEDEAEGKEKVGGTWESGTASWKDNRMTGNQQEIGNRVFCDLALRSAYINTQYRFCECGLWALEERESGILVGKAGITGGELGYHIYRPFRRQGYGTEAGRLIITYAMESLGLETLLLRTEQKNTASIRLAKALGFEFLGESEGKQLYEKKLTFSPKNFIP